MPAIRIANPANKRAKATYSKGRYHARMVRDEVITKLREALPVLRREFGIRDLSVFGSVARGDDRPGSDVDVLVSFEPAARVTLSTLGRLADTLEVLLGRNVDVVEDHPRLRPVFRNLIHRDLRRVA